MPNPEGFCQHLAHLLWLVGLDPVGQMGLIVRSRSSFGPRLHFGKAWEDLDNQMHHLDLAYNKHSKILLAFILLINFYKKKSYQLTPAVVLLPCDTEPTLEHRGLLVLLLALIVLVLQETSSPPVWSWPSDSDNRRDWLVSKVSLSKLPVVPGLSKGSLKKTPLNLVSSSSEYEYEFAFLF